MFKKILLGKSLLFLMLLLGASLAYSQEVCNNGIDDDADLLVDCDDPNCFNAPNYLCACTQSNVLWETNIISGIEWINMSTGTRRILPGPGNNRTATDLAWSPNGSLYSITAAGVVSLRNSNTGAIVSTLVDLGPVATFSPFNAMAFSPDGRMFFSGRGVNEIWVYDPVSGVSTLFATWPPHLAPAAQGASGDLAFRNGLLYLTCEDQQVRGFNLSGTLVSTVSSCGLNPYGLANDANGQLYFTSGTGPIYLFNQTSGTCTATTHTPSGQINGATMWNEFCQACPGTLSIGAFTPPSPSLCAGQTTTVTSNPTGGFTPYRYSWSTGATVNNITAGPGTYSITVTDNVNCSVTGTVTIGLSTPSNITITPSGPTSFCNGNSVTLTASGASTYIWSNGSTTTSILATTPGVYNVTGTSADGCTGTATPVTVTVWATPSAAAGPDASVTGAQIYTIPGVVASGGTPGYTYTWRTSPVVTGNGSTISNPTFGPFTTATTLNVTVTDVNSCTATDFAVITHNSCPLSATITSVTNVTCNGLSNGAIDISVSGGTGTVSYLWAPGGATTQDRTGLPAGNYSVTISDQAGCVLTLNPTVTQPNVLQAGVCTDANDRCQLNQGQIRVQATGGIAPYTVTLTPNHGTPANPATINANNGTVTISGLHGGVNYSVVVRDANGCQTP